MYRFSNRLWFVIWSLLATGAVADDAADDAAEALPADEEFLEFLGQMGDAAEEWDEFMDITADTPPTVMAETDL